MRRVFEMITYIASVVVLFMAMVVFVDYIGMGFPDVFVSMLIGLFGTGFALYAASLLLHFIKQHSFPMKKYFFVPIIPMISVLGQVAVAVIWLAGQLPYPVSECFITMEEAFRTICIILMLDVLSLPTLIHVIAWNIRHHGDGFDSQCDKGTVRDH